MKKNLLLLLCLFCLVNVCHAKAKDTFTVFQLNLWHGCTKVPNGDQGIIDVLRMSFFCAKSETENSLSLM